MWLWMLFAQDPAPAVEAAQPPPENLDDIVAWEKAARLLIDGPDACVRVQGRVSVRVALYAAGGWLSPGTRRDVVAEGTFEGRLDHGVWTSLTTTWAPPEGPDALTLDRFHPIVGRLAPSPPDAPPDPGMQIKLGGSSFRVSGGSGEAPGLLDQLLEEIDAETTASYTRWEGGAVELLQEVPLDSGERLVVKTSFPGAGPPTSMDATFPAKVRVGSKLLKVTLMDAQLHLRGKTTPLGTLPGEEGVSVVMGTLGFTLGFDQRVSYQRAAACGG